MRTRSYYSLHAAGILLLLIGLAACSSATDSGVSPGIETTATPAPSGFVPGDALPSLEPYATSTPEIMSSADEGVYQELMWEELVPPGYRPEEIMAKYQDRLNGFADSDPAAMDLYSEMMDEYNNAPINELLDQSSVKLPGFIAPLEYVDGIITEFLLVPYFGACIHVPPPPVNQTVHVTMADGEGIIPADSFYPVWVYGNMTAEGLSTEIGEAGYSITDATFTLYVYEPPES
jgi:hypothetical protein